MTAPTVESLTTLGGLVIVVTLLMELLKRTMPTLNTARWGPLLSVGAGIVLSVLAVVTLGLTPTGGGTAIVNAVILGIFAGLSASGLYDNATSLVPPSTTTETSIP